MNAKRLYLVNCVLRRAFNRSSYGINREKAPMDLLKETIRNRDIKSVEDWKNVRNELLDNKRHFTPTNIDAMLVGVCTSLKRLDLAFSYFDFLKQEKLKPNLATIGKYFGLFYLQNCNKDSIPKTTENMILSLYEDLRKSYPILDSVTLDKVIRALALTKEWTKCLQLLEEIGISSNASHHSYSAIIAACFSNGDEDLGWKLLREMLEKEKTPQGPVYLSFLKLAGNSKSPLTKLEELFNFMQENHLKCSKLVAEQLLKESPKFKCIGKLATINQRGSCKCCRTELKNFDLNEKEFADLKLKLLDKVLIGKNVFNKTTPDELKQFLDFAYNLEHHDVVIDGLNVAYSVGVRQSPLVTSGFVKSVVAHFVKQKKKVLVLGRKHMNKLPRQNWGYVQQNATVFLTQDLSQDDPYLLYCALNSGRDTIIVTRDLMRGHKFLLKNYREKMVFERWLHNRQFQLLHVNNDGKTFFKVPLPYMEVAQKNGNYWHIPIENEASSSSSRNKNNTNNEIISWLCLKLS